jgi:UDP-N-acetylmuramoyl-tripeptide--D-alanyl-D-alanine ligase
MRWTVDQVARALGVNPPAGLDPLARLAGVSIDSRTVRAGELFIAIHGPRHDGHSFVAAALAAGALCAVVARARLDEFPAALRAKLVAVDDTLAALQELARSVRRAWGRRLAGVTGSTGKTTTKEILAALVSARCRVLKSEGNLNNEYGLPLTLLRLEEEHEAAVVELGMSHRGEIARLADIAEPNVGIVTNVAPVHLEFFSSVDEIAAAKHELVDGLAGADPVAVLNADDVRVARFADDFAGRVVTFGESPGARFRLEEFESRGEAGSAFTVAAPAWRERFELPLAGRHNAMNALAALAAASLWGVGAAEAREVFGRLAPAAMRGEILHLGDGITVINDAYNSNPVALNAMTDLLAATPANGRRILAAGEMLELGATSAALHREAGRYAAATGKVDWILGVQGHAAELVLAAEDAGLPESRARFFATADEAAQFLCGLLEPGDVLLVKGSRGVRMERIVEALQEKFGAAKTAKDRRREQVKAG